MDRLKKGIWYALGAYGSWGLFPIYWKWLHHVPALQIIGHRIFWSFLTLALLLFILRQWREFRASITRPFVMRVYLAASVLIGVNWLTYIWAVNTDHIVETSLGYFINPLLSVLLGTIFLRERLRARQWIPIGLAAVGVLFLAVIHGSVPWIAFAVAFSFALYGLVKKIAPLGSIHGLTLETGLLFLPAVVYLFLCETNGSGEFFRSDMTTEILLAGAGIVTTLPLLMFASAARRIPLSLVGILQYLSPTLQFLIGVLVYGEPFSAAQFAGYAIVWMALILFGLEGYLAHRTSRATATRGETDTTVGSDAF